MKKLVHVRLILLVIIIFSWFLTHFIETDAHPLILNSNSTVLEMDNGSVAGDKLILPNPLHFMMSINKYNMNIIFLVFIVTFGTLITQQRRKQIISTIYHHSNFF